MMSAAGIDWDLAAEMQRLLREGPKPLPRHRHDLPIAQVQLIQRTRILIATAELVVEAGYGGAAITGIAKRAGVSSKTFYQHYADKDAAFIDLYTLLDAAIFTFSVQLQTCTSAEEAIELGMRAYANMLANSGPIGYALVVVAVGASRAIIDRRLESLNQFAAVIDERLTALHESVDDDAVMGILGGANEIAFQHLLLHGSAGNDELVDRLLRFGRRLL